MFCAVHRCQKSPKFVATTSSSKSVLTEFWKTSVYFLGTILVAKPGAEVKKPPLNDDALRFDLRRFDLGIGSLQHPFSTTFRLSTVHRCHR